MSEYFRTNSKYRWLKRSWSQCWDHVLEEELEVLGDAPALDTWNVDELFETFNQITVG